MATNVLTVELASGEPLDVRDFSVEEGLSSLFEVQLTAVSPSADVDFEAAVGKPARFEILRTSGVDGETRHWSGVCARAEMIGVEEDGLSTYSIRIVPELWLLTQRRNYRIFQDQSELDIVLAILGEWGITPKTELDAGSYGKRRMRSQYAESDFHFISRLLEDIGVTYHFEQAGGDTQLVLVDAPSKRAPRPKPVEFVDRPNERVPVEWVTEVRTFRQIKPGKYTQSDVDYRKARSYPLAATSAAGSSVETRLERYHHNYGSFLWKGGGSGETPSADDRGAARTSEKDGGKQVDKRLDAQRVDARQVTFRTIAHDLRPGKVFTINGHPRAELGAPLLVFSSRWTGNAFGEWTHTCECRYTDVAFRPALTTPKPRTMGVESATVTGPAGEEIHCDELGRVRVHFHWDRAGAADETSSCWVPVSQAWAGAGFGAINLPRVGQEVLVDFLGSDPDRPLVMGRVFTTTTPPPYQLPQYKMVSGLRSESYPRPRSSGPQNRLGGGAAAAQAPPEDTPPPAVPAGGGMPIIDLGGAAIPLTPLPAHPLVTAGATSLTVPAGGGMPITGLGGGDGSSGSAGGSAPAAQAQPGVFGGLQAAPEELHAAVTRMQSLGPDGRDHGRHANAVVFDDRRGHERVYFQSHNDLFMTVRRNYTASVGANRAFMIMGNDYEEIPSGYQATKVGRDRTVEVQGLQHHVVNGNIIVDGMENQVTHIKKDAYTQTIEGGQIFQALTGIMLRVGTGSTIYMTPTAIVIDSEKVIINPGPEVMAAINSGVSPEAATAAKQRADRIAAGAAYIVDRLRNGYENFDYMREDLRDRALGAMDRAAAGNPDWNSGYPDWAREGGATGPGEAELAIASARQQLTRRGGQ